MGLTKNGSPKKESQAARFFGNDGSMKKTIGSGSALLAIGTFCLLGGCAASAPKGTPEPEIITGTGSDTIEGPKYLSGRPLGSPGPNGAVVMPER